jgi:hypothetical protein
MQQGIADEAHEDNLYHQQIYGGQTRGHGQWLTTLRAPPTIISLLMLFVAGGMLWATYTFIAEAKRSSADSNRAWLAPMAASLVSKAENGKPINLVLQYNNVGRAPASDINISYALNVFPNEAIDNGKAMAAIADSPDVCQNVEPAIGTVVFPGPPARLFLGINQTDPKSGKHIPLYDAYMSGNQTLAARFCIAYTTFGVTHKSAFCYLHRPDAAGGLGLIQCVVGNHAD